MSQARTLRGALMVALAATGWGTWSLFFRPAEALGPLAPQAESMAAMLGMAIVCVPLALAQPRPTRGARAWWGMLLYGVADAVNGLLFFRAMQVTTVAIAVLTHSLAPLLVAALSPLVMKEKARPGVWMALSLAFLGLVCLLEPWSTPARGALEGALYGFASAVLYTVVIFTCKRISGSFTAPELTGYHAIPAALVLWISAPAGAFALTGDQALILGAAGLGPGALGALLFLAGLARVPASTAAVLVLLEPLVATLLGIFVWGEALRPLAIVGALLMLGGVLLALRAQRD